MQWVTKYLERVLHHNGGYWNVWKSNLYVIFWINFFSCYGNAYKIKFRFGVNAFQDPPLCSSNLRRSGVLNYFIIALVIILNIKQPFSYCVEKTFDSGLHLTLYLVQGSVLHPPVDTRKYTCGAATLRWILQQLHHKTVFA